MRDSDSCHDPFISSRLASVCTSMARNLQQRVNMWLNGYADCLSFDDTVGSTPTLVFSILPIELTRALLHLFSRHCTTQHCVVDQESIGCLQSHFGVNFRIEFKFLSTRQPFGTRCALPAAQPRAAATPRPGPPRGVFRRPPHRKACNV